MPGHPFDQSSYQVRLDWGVDGLVRVAPSDVVVVVDVLRFSSTVIQAVENGRTVELDAAAHAVSINGAAVAEAAAGSGATVLLGGLRNASAVARATSCQNRGTTAGCWLPYGRNLARATRAASRRRRVQHRADER